MHRSFLWSVQQSCNSGCLKSLLWSSRESSMHIGKWVRGDHILRAVDEAGPGCWLPLIAKLSAASGSVWPSRNVTLPFLSRGNNSPPRGQNHMVTKCIITFQGLLIQVVVYLVQVIWHWPLKVIQDDLLHHSMAQSSVPLTRIWVPVSDASLHDMLWLYFPPLFSCLWP